jgi:hypothetical protein
MLLLHALILRRYLRDNCAGQRRQAGQSRTHDDNWITASGRLRGDKLQVL